VTALDKLVELCEGKPHMKDDGHLDELLENDGAHLIEVESIDLGDIVFDASGVPFIVDRIETDGVSFSMFGSDDEFLMALAGTRIFVPAHMSVSKSGKPQKVDAYYRTISHNEFGGSTKSGLSSHMSSVDAHRMPAHISRTQTPEDLIKAHEKMHAEYRKANADAEPHEHHTPEEKARPAAVRAEEAVAIRAGWSFKSATTNNAVMASNGRGTVVAEFKNGKWVLRSSKSGQGNWHDQGEFDTVEQAMVEGDKLLKGTLKTKLLGLSADDSDIDAVDALEMKLAREYVLPHMSVDKNGKPYKVSGYTRRSGPSASNSEPSSLTDPKSKALVAKIRKAGIGRGDIAQSDDELVSWLEQQPGSSAALESINAGSSVSSVVEDFKASKKSPKGPYRPSEENMPKATGTLTGEYEHDVKLLPDLPKPLPPSKRESPEDTKKYLADRKKRQRKEHLARIKAMSDDELEKAFQQAGHNLAIVDRMYFRQANQAKKDLMNEIQRRKL
jgi:hypothetical protein